MPARLNITDEERKERNLEAGRRYYESHKSIIAERNQVRYWSDPNKFRTRGRKYHSNNTEICNERCRVQYEKNPEAHIARVTEWGLKNPEKKRANRRNSYRKKYDTDAAFRTLLSLRGRLSKVCRMQGVKKCASTEKILGCSIGRFMEYLKAHFKPGMTFANYGSWHIDHRKPCAKFNLTDPEEQKACFSWLNLQPLWAKENLSKNDRFDEALQPA